MNKFLHYIAFIPLYVSRKLFMFFCNETFFTYNGMCIILKNMQKKEKFFSFWYRIGGNSKDFDYFIYENGI